MKHILHWMKYTMPLKDKRMDKVVLDFETYYDKEVSLSKQTMLEYITDSRFEVLLCSIQINDGSVIAYEGGEIASALNAINWQNAVLVCHNAIFDGAILHWHYGHTPARVVCTMSLARALRFDTLYGSVALATIADTLRDQGHNIPAKGEERSAAIGKRKKDFSYSEWEAYKAYCCNDTLITSHLYEELKPHVSREEIQFQDIILRCYTEPSLRVHEQTALLELARAKGALDSSLATAASAVGMDKDAMASSLRSMAKFENILRRFGGVTQDEAAKGTQHNFIIPTKISPTTGKTMFAFSKADKAFLDLPNHCSDSVSAYVDALVQARLQSRSNIAESRAQRFVDIAKKKACPIPYSISAAHTGRLGGTDKLNFQNLPSGRVQSQTDLLRRSIIAPDGHVIVNYDSSQIEARVLAYLAGQEDLLEVFRSGQDPYIFMAADIYGVPAEELAFRAKVKRVAIDVKRRKVGKAAVLGCGYGMSATTFHQRAALDGILVSEEFSAEIVKKYRHTMNKISKFWRTCDDIIKLMASGGSASFGGPNGDTFYATGQDVLFGKQVSSILLPDGMRLVYPNLRYETVDVEGIARGQYVYDVAVRKGKTETISLYGGKLTENLCQAYAFAVLKHQAVEINKLFHVKMNTHDEFSVVVPWQDGTRAGEYMAHVMSSSPVWAQGLPLEAEGGYAQSYGDIGDDFPASNPARAYAFGGVIRYAENSVIKEVTL